MRLVPLLLAAVCLFCAASPAKAEREIHVVAVNRGWIAPGDFRNGPEARVIVDRPGSEVILVLLDAGPVTWRVEATEGSFIEAIFLGSDPVHRNRVEIDGIRLADPRDERLSHVNKPRGPDFRRLLAHLAETNGLDRIASFQSAHAANGSGHRVNRVDHGTDTLILNYLETKLQSAAHLPTDLRSWLHGARPENAHTASFDETGMTLTTQDGIRRFPFPAHLPTPRLPTGSFYDVVDKVLYGITVGGAGHLYRLDTVTGAWQIVVTLDRFDAATVYFDRATDRFFLTGAFSRPGDIRVISRDGTGQTTRIDFTRFPGLSDLYDYENEPAPPLHPRAYQDGWLLLEAREDAPPGLGRLRVYAVHIETSEVRLLDYTGR